MNDRPDDREPGPPRWVPYTPPPPDGWDRVRVLVRRLSFPVVLVLVGAGFAALFYWVDQQEARPSTPTSVNVTPSELGRSTGASPGSSGNARLFVNSVPEGAVVRLNGDSVGTTPLTDSLLRSGAYMLSVQAPGYLRTDTVVVLNEGTDARLRFALRSRPGATAPPPSSQTETPAPPTSNSTAPPASRPPPVTAVPESADEVPNPSRTTGALYVTSTPLGAVVSIEGTERGRTPLSVDALSAGSKQVGMAMEGYRPWRAQVNVQADSTRRVHADLVQQTGRLRVLARPWGTIYVNGTLQVRESDVWFETQLPGGTHRVTAVHPSLGTQVRTVEVQPDEETSIVIDLQAQNSSEGAS
jgi:hypothetical protein